MLKVDHTALAVTDLETSRAFYTTELGGVVVSKPSPRFVEILLGNIRLHLVQADGTAPLAAGPRIDHLCLAVERLDELHAMCRRLNACAAIAARGPYAVEDSPPLGLDGEEHAEERPPTKTLYFHDPDGLGLEVRCYTAD